MSQLQQLRDELNAEIAKLEEQCRSIRCEIGIRLGTIARIDRIMAEAPDNPVPTATRQPRRNLQNLVLSQITSRPHSAAVVRARVETAADAAVADSSVKRVLDALVKKGKIRTDGNEYFLSVPVTGEPRAAE